MPTSSLHATDSDIIQVAEHVEDASHTEYLQDLAVRIFQWLAMRMVHEGMREFKIRDVKHQFKTITPVFLEQVIEILVEEGKVKKVMKKHEATHSRITVYAVDVVQAASLIT